jgi:hypothetical protein
MILKIKQEIEWAYALYSPWSVSVLENGFQFGSVLETGCLYGTQCGSSAPYSHNRHKCSMILKIKLEIEWAYALHSPRSVSVLENGFQFGSV